MFRRRFFPFLLFLLSLVLGVFCLISMPLRDIVLLVTGAILPRLITFVVECFEVPTLYGPIAGISGRWGTIWTCDREEEGFQEYSDILHVHRIGTTIWGRCRFSMVDRPYLIRGRLVRGGMVNGRWKSKQPGSDYHGVFILRMGEEGDELYGFWLGTSEQLETHHGEWRWRR